MMPVSRLLAVLAASASALTLPTVGRVGMPRTRSRATGVTSAATFTEAAQTGDWRAAMALLEAQAAPANASSFAKTISACGQAGRHEEALTLMSRMRAAGHEPDTWTYNAVMAACGEWEVAVETLNEMSDSTWAPPDVSSFNTAMTAACRAGEAQRTLELFTRMTDKGLDPDEISYNLAISACRRAGLGARAAELVEQMEAEGIMPGEEALTNGLWACAASASDGGAAAAALWDRLLAAAAAAGSDGGSGHPPPRAFTAALAVASRAADAERAAALLEMMRDRDLAPDEVALSFAVR